MAEQRALLAELRQRLRKIERAYRSGRCAASTGLAVLDTRLPWGGLPRGALHEVLGEAEDAARFCFVAALLARLPTSAGRILWCRASAATAEVGRPYGSGLDRLGLPPERLILLDARHPADVLWAMEEGLRCRGLAAVVGEGVEVSMTASRRLQLAAEAGEGLGLLLPPPGKISPSVALTRWQVKAAPGRFDPAGLGRSRWEVALLRCRGGGGQGAWLVEFDDAALRLVLAAELADRSLAAAQ